jgi:hypothetical protein
VATAVLVLAAVVLAAQALGTGEKTKPKKRVPPPFLNFTVFSQTGLPLSDLTWTGERFVYATQTLGQFSQSGPTGSPLTPFATIPGELEEVRCRPSPGRNGWPAGMVFCHAPHGEIYRLAPDGTATLFASLTENDKQDGVLAFDTAGLYGHAMLVTTGGPNGDGGTVFAIAPDATQRRLGSFPGPGGADNLEMAPAQFGIASNQLLIAIDYDPGGGQPGAGRVYAMAPDGSLRSLVKFAEGLNPIMAVGRGDAPRGAARPGLYISDSSTKTVYFLPASVLATRYPNTVLVGSEKTAHFWLVRANRTGYAQLRLQGSLERASPTWNLEGGDWIG